MNAIRDSRLFQFQLKRLAEGLARSTEASPVKGNIQNVGFAFLEGMAACWSNLAPQRGRRRTRKNAVVVKWFVDLGFVEKPVLDGLDGVLRQKPSLCAAVLQAEEAISAVAVAFNKDNDEWKRKLGEGLVHKLEQLLEDENSRASDADATINACRIALAWSRLNTAAKLIRIKATESEERLEVVSYDRKPGQGVAAMCGDEGHPHLAEWTFTPITDPPSGPKRVVRVPGGTIECPTFGLVLTNTRDAAKDGGSRILLAAGSSSSSQRWQCYKHPAGKHWVIVNAVDRRCVTVGHCSRGGVANIHASLPTMHKNQMFRLFVPGMLYGENPL